MHSRTSPLSFFWAPSRRRLQFSIRSILSLTFVVAALFACWVRPALNQRAALAALRGHYTDVSYDVPRDPRTAEPLPRMIPQRWVRFLGIEYFANIVELEIYDPTDDVLRNLVRLPKLRALTLHGTDFTTEAGARSLRRLPQLRTLTLAGYGMSEVTRHRFESALPECIIQCEPCDFHRPTPSPPPAGPLAAVLPTPSNRSSQSERLRECGQHEPTPG